MSSANSRTRATRDRILAVTADLLGRPDTKKVLMSDIAKAAGLSRQAVYLHFKTRADLLIATTRYIDEQENLPDRLQATHQAISGRDKLLAFIEFWGQHLPIVEGVAQALIAMQSEDEAAAAAWSDRMMAARGGCEMVIQTLANDGDLSGEWTVQTGADVLMAMLSFQNWQQLVRHCNWSEAEYIARMQSQALRTLTDK